MTGSFWGWGCRCCKITLRRYSTAKPPVCEQTWNFGGKAQPFAVDPSDGGVYHVGYSSSTTASTLAKRDNADNPVWSLPFTSVATNHPFIDARGANNEVSVGVPGIGGVSVSPDGKSIAWAGKFVPTGGDPTQSLVITDTAGNQKSSLSNQWTAYVATGFFCSGDPVWSTDSQYIFIPHTTGVLVAAGSLSYLLKIRASDGVIVNRWTNPNSGVPFVNGAFAASAAMIGGTLYACNAGTFVETLYSVDQSTGVFSVPLATRNGVLQAFPDGNMLTANLIDPGINQNSLSKWPMPPAAGSSTWDAGIPACDATIDATNRVYGARATKVSRVASGGTVDYTYTIPQTVAGVENPSLFCRMDRSSDKIVTGGDYVKFVAPG